MAGYEQDYFHNRKTYRNRLWLITTEVNAISSALGTKEVDDLYIRATQGIFGRIIITSMKRILLA